MSPTREKKMKWVADETRLTNAVREPMDHTVACERLEPDVGLCIHRNVSGRGWMITHTASGLCLSVCWRNKKAYSRTTARKIVAAIKGIVDWKQSAQELRDLNPNLDITFAEKVGEIEMSSR